MEMAGETNSLSLPTSEGVTTCGSKPCCGSVIPHTCLTSAARFLTVLPGTALDVAQAVRNSHRLPPKRAVLESKRMPGRCSRPWGGNGELGSGEKGGRK